MVSGCNRDLNPLLASQCLTNLIIVNPVRIGIYIAYFSMIVKKYELFM